MERGNQDDDVDGRAEITDLEVTQRRKQDQRSRIRDSRTAILCVVALAIFTDLVGKLKGVLSNKLDNHEI